MTVGQQPAASAATSTSKSHRSPASVSSSNQNQHHQQPSCPSAPTNASGGGGAANTSSSSIQVSNFSPSAAFQQVKQTQASKARLTRIHEQLHCQTQTATANTNTNTNTPQQPSSQLTTQPNNVTPTTTSGQQQATKTTTFVDCLIRRFKDCFSEDFCTVPMFVVGNLSPGSDGTHLILPPCVSLGRQNMSRFASPKNLRHMNSIRESCKSIEQLDLGGNKLTDLIEVYKILQCTPNLKFLNLSENDLSKTSPVAMATTCCPPTATNLASVGHQSTFAAGNWSSNSNSSSSRHYLAPINQNHHCHASMAQRRHSTLCQSSSRPAASAPIATPLAGRGRSSAAARVAEARRVAAANALAQSKKTSSHVASKLTAAAKPVGSSGVSGVANASVGAASARGSALGSASRTSTTSGGKLGSPASTMHLARSLSSLSAKEVRAATSKLAASSRLSSHRRDSEATDARFHRQQQQLGSHQRPTTGSSSMTRSSSANLGANQVSQRTVASKTSPVTSTGCRVPMSASMGKLFAAEPIAELDNDVDMIATASGAESQQPTAQQQQVDTQTTISRLSSQPTGSSSSSSSRSPFSFQGSSSASTSYRRTFESVEALALNNTGCQWRVVCSILNRMPNLEELHLSLNNYHKIDLEPQEFKHYALKRLYLCNNPKLSNWDELNKLLMAFPSLEALSIADCNISQIPDNLAASREWRKICGLNINGWPIKEWPVIERLNQLPSLIDLKCRNLEILNTIDEPRHHLIARLPKLQRLNGSEIEEREHAEKAFLRFFMANSHLERPSRFHELIQIHGEVGMSPVEIDFDLSPPSHAQVRVIYLNRNFYEEENQDDILMSEDFLNKLMDNVDSSSSATTNMETIEADNDSKRQPVRLFKDDRQEVVSIEVDLRQSVRKFKSTLANFFGLDNQSIILYYIDHEMVGLMGPELIKHNQKKLWNYNVQDGDQFIVEER